MSNQNIFKNPLNTDNKKIDCQRRPDQTEKISALLSQRILILDGAMGTMIQDHNFNEEDFRGERFRDWSQDL